MFVCDGYIDSKTITRACICNLNNVGRLSRNVYIVTLGSFLFRVYFTNGKVF